MPFFVLDFTRCWVVCWPKKDESRYFKDANEVCAFSLYALESSYGMTFRLCLKQIMDSHFDFLW